MSASDVEVEEVVTAEEDPVLECVTHQERVCHTTHTTHYTARRGKVRQQRRPANDPSVFTSTGMAPTMFRRLFSIVS